MLLVLISSLGNVRNTIILLEIDGMEFEEI